MWESLTEENIHIFKEYVEVKWYKVWGRYYNTSIKVKEKIWWSKYGKILIVLLSNLCGCIIWFFLFLCMLIRRFLETLQHMHMKGESSEKTNEQTKTWF